MALHEQDRRRILIATIVTLIALPAIWLFNRSDDSSGPTVASVGVEIDDAGDTATTAPPEPGQEPVFLDGPSSGNGGIAEIAVPAPPLREAIAGSATYSSIIISVDKCFAHDVTTGTRITVVNLDNNRSVSCRATLAPSSQRDQVVLHTRAFNQLADLTDAPIPVEIRQ